MKCLLVSHSDSKGGAARACFRTHRALLSCGVSSKLLVNHSSSDDINVISPESILHKASVLLRPQLSSFLVNTLKTSNPIIHSPSIFRSRIVNTINRSDADIVHFHWVQSEMLSISDFARIKKPFIFTMHDMWLFSGAEHYTQDSRWLHGYTSRNRPSYESGFDLNKFTWSRKVQCWKSLFPVIGNCSWISESARNSYLLSQHPIYTIPNPIDTKFWKPVDSALARSLFNLPTNSHLVLFSSLGTLTDSRKGLDLLLTAIVSLPSSINRQNVEFVLLGSCSNTLLKTLSNLGIKFHLLGRLFDDISLKILYSAVDLVAIPSRQETLTNVGVEAQACGRPVVAFRTTGLTDIVQHTRTGYLAKAFSPSDFADGIVKILSNQSDTNLELQHNCRERAVSLWSYDIVGPQLLKLYKSILS